MSIRYNTVAASVAASVIASVIGSTIAPAAAQSAQPSTFPTLPTPQPQFDAPVNAPGMTALVAPRRVAVREKGPLSSSSALAWTLGGTALGIAGLAVLANSNDSSNPLATALAMGAVATGPSWGRWYGHEMAIGTMTTRFLGVALLASISGGDDEPPGGIILTGLGMVAASTIYDLIRAGSVADEYNEEFHKRRSERAPRLAPTVLATSNGGIASGVALSGSF